MATLYPAVFNMKRGGQIKALVEVCIELPDPNVGIFYKSIQADGDAYLETKKGFKKANWLYKHCVGEPEIILEEND